MDPHPAEGYSEMIELKNEEEIENCIQKLTIQHLEQKVEGMEGIIRDLRKKVKDLEVDAKKNKQQQQQQQQQALLSNPYSSINDDMQ